jgi:hypothetical protein
MFFSLDRRGSRLQRAERLFLVEGPLLLRGDLSNLVDLSPTIIGLKTTAMGRPATSLHFQPHGSKHM